MRSRYENMRAVCDADQTTHATSRRQKQDTIEKPNVSGGQVKIGEKRTFTGRKVRKEKPGKGLGFDYLTGPSYNPIGEITKA